MVQIPDDRICFTIRLVLADGEKVERSWTWGDVVRGDYPRWPFAGGPNWLKHPERHQEGPLEPSVFNGHVPAGMERYARKIIERD